MVEYQNYIHNNRLHGREPFVLSEKTTFHPFIRSETATVVTVHPLPQNPKTTEIPSKRPFMTAVIFLKIIANLLSAFSIFYFAMAGVSN